MLGELKQYVILLALSLAIAGCTDQKVSSKYDLGVLENAENFLDEYQENKLRSYHGHWTGERNLFMPNPGKTMLLHKQVAFPEDSAAIYFEILVKGGKGPNEGIVTVEAEGASWKLEITEDKQIVASPGDDLVRSNIGNGLVGITIEKIAGEEVRVCIKGNCATTAGSPLEGGVTVGVHAPHVSLSNPQAIDNAGLHQTVAAEATGHARTPHPRGVLAWERFSSRFYNRVLGLVMANEVCTSSPEHARHSYCESRMDEVPSVAKRALLQLSAWPTWRAHDARISMERLATESRSWDRNSWANGFIPAISAYLYLLTRDVITHDEARSVRETYEQKGARFLADPIFTTKANHWINRSSNHGAIILGNGYAAELIYGDCKESELGETLRHNFRRVAERSIQEGAYTEGNAYLQVFVLDSLAAAFALNHCSGTDIETFFDEFYGPDALSDIANYAESITLEDGKYMLVFGDCCPSRYWRDHLVALLAPHSEFFQQLMNQEKTWKGSEALRAFIDRKSTRSQAANRAARKEYASACYSTEFGIGVSSTVVNERSVRYGLLSTKMHRTHNNDWDLGAFVLAVDEEIIIGERLDNFKRKDRSATRHSTAWTDAIVREYPDCFRDGERCRNERQSNGSMEISTNGSAPCSMSARLNSIGESRRAVEVGKDAGADFSVTIRDSIDVDSDGRFATANYEIAGRVVDQDGDSVALVTPNNVLVALSWAGYDSVGVETVSESPHVVTSVRLRGSAPVEAKGMVEVGHASINLFFQE